MRPLPHVPAVVAPLGDEAHLLEQGLPGVTDHEVAGRHVEREAIWIAEAVREDLVASVRAAGRRGEGVVRRDAVRHRAVHVDSEDVAEQILLDVLSVAAAVVGVPVLDVAESAVVRRAAIADRQVQVPIPPERHRSAVVVGLRIVELKEDALRRGIGSVRIRRDSKLREGGGVVVRRQPPRRVVVHEEPAVRRVLWVEGQTE
jgi:hypothetical protein